MIQRVLEIGPVHHWLPSAMKLRLQLHGDQIVASETEFGFLSKSIETKILKRNFDDAGRLLSRIEPESAFLIDRLYSEAIEKIMGVEVSERALWIREITTEVSEMISLLKYLALMAQRLGLAVLNHILLKHREELLDLVELLTGSRFGYYYLVPGGARYDVTEGFLERLDFWAKNFQADYAKIESMYLWTHAFQNRLKSLGRVVDQGSFGFVSESSVENTQLGVVSHIESRLLYALKKSLEVAAELKEMIAEKTTGAHTQKEALAALAKPSIQHAEVALPTYRGTWALNLAVSKDKTIQSIEVSTPSDEIQKAIPFALAEESIEDVLLILQSLNFLVTEIDR
jgi:NADH:ubiquinone oxidoreductase subunit D